MLYSIANESQQTPMQATNELNPVLDVLSWKSHLSVDKDLQKGLIFL